MIGGRGFQVNSVAEVNRKRMLMALVLLCTTSLILSVPVAQAQFSFDLEIIPLGIVMEAGSSAQCRVNVRLLIGPTREVSLIYSLSRVAGLSAGASTARGIPPFTVDIRVSTTAQTPSGNYVLSIVAVGGGVTRQASVPITVTEAQPPSPAGLSTDWAVGAVWLSPSNPRTGDAVRFFATLSALTSNGAFPQQVYVAFYLDGHMIGGEAVAVPRAGMAATVGTGSTWTATLGSHVILFVADPINGYNDGNRNNNRRELPFIISAGPLQASFDFSVTVAPASQSLRPEGSVVHDVHIDLLRGTSETVALTLSGLPSDATYAFDPPTGRPPYQSKLTIYVPEYTAAGAPMPAGTYTFTVTAEGGGSTRSATAGLTIVSAVATTSTAVATTSAGPQTTASSTRVAETEQPARGDGMLLSLVIVLVVVVAVALTAYYFGKRHRAKPPSKM